MEHSITSPFNGEQACASKDPEIFFPDEDLDPSGVQDAKWICLSCPNLSDCLTYALSRTNLEGIWGATTTRERVNIRRRKARV